MGFFSRSSSKKSIQSKKRMEETAPTKVYETNWIETEPQIVDDEVWIRVPSLIGIVKFKILNQDNVRIFYNCRLDSRDPNAERYTNDIEKLIVPLVILEHVDINHALIQYMSRNHSYTRIVAMDYGRKFRFCRNRFYIQDFPEITSNWMIRITDVREL
jgi:hypothetical protein